MTPDNATMTNWENINNIIRADWEDINNIISQPIKPVIKIPSAYIVKQFKTFSSKISKINNAFVE